jgi:hypothetical protein
MHQTDFKPEPAQLVDTAGVGGPRSIGRHYSLKHGDTYMVVDALGDITGNADGLFTNDTRVLSCWRLTIGGAADTTEFGDRAGQICSPAHLTQPPAAGDRRSRNPRASSTCRTQFLWRDARSKASACRLRRPSCCPSVRFATSSYAEVRGLAARSAPRSHAALSIART